MFSGDYFGSTTALLAEYSWVKYGSIRLKWGGGNVYLQHPVPPAEQADGRCGAGLALKTPFSSDVSKIVLRRPDSAGIFYTLDINTVSPYGNAPYGDNDDEIYICTSAEDIFEVVPVVTLLKDQVQSVIGPEISTLGLWDLFLPALTHVSMSNLDTANPDGSPIEEVQYC